MEGMSSTPAENSVQFLRLRDKYKSDLFEDTRLNKAASLAAKKELLLNSSASPKWKEPRLKAVNRELHYWATRLRQPGGTREITTEDDTDDENLAVAPFHRCMGNIAQLRKGMKGMKTEPVTPAIQTPVIKKSQSTGKKRKVSTKAKSVTKFKPKLKK